jgi:hypothetical protein
LGWGPLGRRYCQSENKFDTPRDSRTSWR